MVVIRSEFTEFKSDVCLPFKHIEVDINCSFLKNEINHCIEGITQCRPTHDIRMKAQTGDYARGAQLPVTQRSTQTSCRAWGAGGFHN